MRRRGHPAGLAVLALLVSLLGAPALASEDAAGEGTVAADATEGTEKAPVPWRGSAISWRHAATALTFAKDADPTYNPTYDQTLTFSPRWSFFGKYLRLSADLSLTWELTDSDWTQYDRETIVSDLMLGVSSPNFYQIPVVGIDLGAGLNIQTPTSKASQARTLYLGLRPWLSISRSFDVLSGITVGYRFGFTKYFNEYTTAQREDLLIGACAGSAANCAEFFNTGRRNPSMNLTHSLFGSIDFTKWLGLSMGVTFFQDILYDGMDPDPRVTYETQKATNSRYLMAYEFELYSRPIPSLTVALGAQTVSPQLAPDSTYETPFFNRYTAVYLNLTFHIDGFIEQLTGEDGR